MKLLLVPAIFLLLYGGDTWQPNPAPVSKHKFIVVAHRGDHVVYPENTLAAYQEAIKTKPITWKLTCAPPKMLNR